ncbi:hypothetical protein SLUN_00800 [Streptomyces lunaelactis]|uniref:Metal-binding protein n=1 Tax=Streptomyces lunaelactis TaxID=1535768 RepID=A0A2R4SVX4_9ACTN|nr:DUF2182 domain-containing protein [Streptomyces lunaelactis]AVZ71008.1 hypothetical protein SLUN_00800 [Streptomyces lunaelactis]NUK25710.1 DUF2182 domain-containing protein [Streptomyces lunaelactis]NUK86070.1 DUF2182 domain-containing protein [Streptomyces lunaelactis]
MTAVGAAARSRPTVAVVTGAVVAAVGLLLWQLSPTQSLLGHDLAAGWAGVGWFAVSWLLMTVATMLPTSLPLLRAFTRLLGDRRDAGRLVATVVAGYLTLWTVAGLGLAAVDSGVHALVGRTPYAWVVLPLTLLVAGAYQLSGTSARCLTACRSPFSFLARRWSGRRPVGAEAALVGLDYGLSCLGCCAALMLVMFAVGMSSPLLMIALGGVAALHKHAPWGAALARVTGVALIMAAIVVGAAHLAGGAGHGAH